MRGNCRLTLSQKKLYFLEHVFLTQLQYIKFFFITQPSLRQELRMKFRIWPLIDMTAWLGFELPYLFASPKWTQNVFQGKIILLLPHSEAQFCFFSLAIQKICICLLQGLLHNFLKCEFQNPFTSTVLILVSLLHAMGVWCLSISEINRNLQYLRLYTDMEDFAESGPVILVYVLLVLSYCIPTRWIDNILIWILEVVSVSHRKSLQTHDHHKAGGCTSRKDTNLIR